MTQPLISIIVPSFNRAAYLPETIASVQKQTYPNWELIIVDDGSTDDSREVVEQYTEQDARIHYIERSRTPKGGSVCRNIGAEHASGDYLVFLDSDDLLIPQALEQRVQLARQHPKADFIVFPTGYFMETFGDSDKIWNRINKDTWNDLERFFNGDTPWHTTGPLWKKTGFEQTGGFIESAQSGQDFEIHTRALILGLSYQKSPDGHPYIDNYVRRGNDDRVTSASYTTPEKLSNRLDNYSVILTLLKESKTALSDKTIIRFIFRIALEAKDSNAMDIAKESLNLIHQFGFGSKFLVQLLRLKLSGSPVNGLINRILYRIYCLSNLEYAIDRTKGMTIDQLDNSNSTTPSHS